MLIKVQKNTADILAEYISKDPILQLFMQDTVLGFSYDVESVEFFFVTDKAVPINKNENIKMEDVLGVALCLDQVHLYYSQKSDINYDGYIDIINEFQPVMIEAPTSMLEGIFKAMDDACDTYQFSKGEAAILPKDKKLEDTKDQTESYIIKIATEKDITALCKLNRSMEEMAGSYSHEDEEKYTMKLCDNDGRIYYIEKDGEILSMAETAFESKDSVYICDVCTHPAHRKKGYTTQIIKKLCEDLQKEGKGIGISYENLAAGRIYKKLGFTMAGEYAVLEMKE